MEQALAVPLVAFVCLAASVAIGMATHDRMAWRVALPAPPGMLRAMALGLLALAVLALLLLTTTARSDYHRAEAQSRMLAQDVTALDEALRAFGPGAEAARTTLYRYADGVARLLYNDRRDLARPSQGTVDMLRAELGQQVAGIAADGVGAATIAGRLEVMLRSGDTLLRLNPAPGVKWCRPILVAWLMAGLGLLALLTPPRARSAILLTALAVVLSLGMYYLEEMANPFHGTFSVSQGILDDALFAISN